MAYNTVREIQQEAKQEAERVSPVDTGQYIDSHTISHIRHQWNEYIWYVSPNISYGKKVEQGFFDRPVTWSKRDWTPVEQWVWARVYEKTFEHLSGFSKQIALNNL